MRVIKPQAIRISDKESLEWSTMGEPGSEQKSASDLERIAHWLDSVFEIPIIRMRFGVDALLGLVPGVGDTASAFASIYILQAATKFGVSRVTLARMTLNIAVDLMVGAIPIVGDLFDVYWKANRKNVELLRQHINANPIAARKLKRSDAVFVAAMITAIIVILVASIAGTYYIITRSFEFLTRL